MKEKAAVAATVQQCLTTWGSTVKRAAEAGYTFCLVGYFEISEAEHHQLWTLVTPLLDRIEGQGYQALIFKPNLPSVYDKTGSTVLGQLQGQWHGAGAAGEPSLVPREVRLWSSHYVNTRDVTSDEPPTAQDEARGIAYPPTELPTFTTSHPGYRLTAAVGACWHKPRLK